MGGNMRRLLVALFSVLLLSTVATAQLKLNNIEIMDAGGDVVDAQQVIHTQVDATIQVRNDGPVDYVIRVYDENGVLKAEMGVDDPTNTNTLHGLQPGIYTIKVGTPKAGGGVENERAAGILEVH
jgi:hypothetical protein